MDNPCAFGYLCNFDDGSSEVRARRALPPLRPGDVLPEAMGGHTYAGFKEFVTQAVNEEFQERAE